MSDILWILLVSLCPTNYFHLSGKNILRVGFTEGKEAEREKETERLKKKMGTGRDRKKVNKEIERRDREKERDREGKKRNVANDCVKARVKGNREKARKG